MKNIAEQFENFYTPTKALVIYQSVKDNVYVECHDVDEKGQAYNARPLTVEESIELADLLNCSTELKKGFLKPKGILPTQLLYIDSSSSGYAIWYTPPKKVDMFFAESLHIPNGKAAVPALIWKASKTTLQLYAIKSKEKPNGKTPLYHAPFFNVYDDGEVCMGTVNIEIDQKCMLEEFMQQWEHYFWNSYFSHLLIEDCPVKGNIVELWQQQVGSKKQFPVAQLKRNQLTLKEIFI